MGPKFIVVAIHADGTTTVSTHHDESEAREAFAVVLDLPNLHDAYLATVRTETHR